ncbi:hypothetical protein [Levilactobacillus yonginensis]
MKKLLIGFMAAAMVTTGFATIPTTTAQRLRGINLKLELWVTPTTGA